MNSPLNIHQFLSCESPLHSYVNEKLLNDITDDDLFLTMDEIINQRYPDEHEYDIDDSDEEPVLKKVKCAPIEEISVRVPSQEFNMEKIVKKMYGCRESVTISTKPEERRIQLKIESIFRQMKQTVK